MTPTYNDTTATIQPPQNSISEYDGLQTIRAGVVVPLAQAVATGFLVALPAGLLTSYFKVSDWQYLTAAAFSLGALGQWGAGQALWRTLVKLAERRFQVDFNQDGVIEQTAPQTVRVEITQDNGGGFTQTEYVDLPFGDRLPQLAAGLIAGQKFTVERWVGRSKDKLFTPAEFIELRDAMIEHDWLRPNNPRDITRGYKLTKTGWQVMASLHSPTPAAPRK